MTYYFIIGFFVFFNVLIGIVFLVLDLLGLNFCIFNFINKLYNVFLSLSLKLIFFLPYSILYLLFSLYVKDPIVSMVNIPDNFIVELLVCLIISAGLSYFFRFIFNYFNLNKKIVFSVLSMCTLLKRYIKIYFELCLARGYQMLYSSLYIPYNRNKYIMWAHCYRYGDALMNRVYAKNRADLLLLQDQCRTLQNALPHINVNSPWNHIITEHVSRVQAEEISPLERYLAKFDDPAYDLEENIYSAHARGKSLIYNLNTLESIFV